MPTANRLERPQFHLVLLTAIAAALLFAKLGQTHLANFDDAYYAQKAKEMLQTGDWLTPRYAQTPRYDNPPLFLWLIAIGYRLFGVGETGAIFFSALSGALCVGLLFRLARRLGCDLFEAWVAGFVLLTTQYFVKFARHAMFDVFLTLLFLVAMNAYVDSERHSSRRGLLVVGAATGLGLLTKSVLGLFPLLVVGMHRLWVRGPRGLADPRLLAAGGVAAAIGAPWFLYQLASAGEPFVREHFGWLLWGRSVAGSGTEAFWGNRLGYLFDLGKHYWPWLPFAVVGLGLTVRAAGRAGPDAAGRAARLTIAWVGVVVGVLSLSDAKKLWYIMTVFPALALWSARAIAAGTRTPRTRRRIVGVGYAALAAAVIVFHFTPVPLSRSRQPDLHRIALAARTVTPPGRPVLNLDEGYWSINNVFLFYSDRNLTPPLDDPARVREGLARGDAALLTEAGLRAVEAAGEGGLRLLAESGPWRLVAAGPLEAAGDEVVP